jgi:hypothetical protein
MKLQILSAFDGTLIGYKEIESEPLAELYKTNGSFELLIKHAKEFKLKGLDFVNCDYKLIKD